MHRIIWREEDLPDVTPPFILKIWLNGYLKQAADKIGGNDKAYSDDLTELPRQFRWSYVPPLMVILPLAYLVLPRLLAPFL